MGGFSSTNQTVKNGNTIFESQFRNSFVDFGVMYMLMDPFGVNLSLLMSNSSSFDDGDKEFSSSLTGIRVGGRYYSPCMAPRFYTYGQIDFAFLGGSGKSFDDDGNEIEDDRENLSELDMGLRGGLTYFLTPAISLEMSFAALAWAQQKRTSDANSDFEITTSEFQFFAFSKSLTVGFCWWIGRGGESY